MPVVNMACPKCRREATEYAPNKWKCLHCGIKFLYEAPTPTPSVSVTKVVRGGVDQSEKTLLNFGGDHVVTTSRVKFGDITFPIAGISTVRYEKENNAPRAVTAAVTCYIFGALTTLAGVYQLTVAKKIIPIFFVVSTTYLPFALSLFAYGFWRWRQRKPVHILSVTMHSGETHRLPSRDREGIRQIEEAIHTAIAAQ